MFHEISMITGRCENPLRTDRCRHESVYHNNGLWQLEINRCLLFWCKNMLQCYRSMDKIPELWKSLYVNCDFFYAEDFVDRIGHFCCSTLHLFGFQVSFTTKPQVARKGKSRGETSMWASRQTLQARLLSVHHLQTNEKLRDKMCIHLDCSATHGRAKLVPHWIPQFHQIFTYLAPSKMKTDDKFSCVFTWTWKKTKGNLVNNKS